MSDKKITRERLKELVNEELDRMLNEDVGEVDYDGLSVITKQATDMLKSIKKFEQKASPQMMHHLSSPFKKVKETLHDMAVNPSSYLMQPKKVRKVVSLKPAGKSTIPQP